MTNANAVMSMTGFAQTEGQAGPVVWRLEMKSVNGKGFDLRCRMPSGFEALETQARTQTAQLIKRGSLTLSVNLEVQDTARGARLNRALLDDVLKLAKELSAENIKLEHLLAVRGVIEVDEAQIESSPELLSALDKGLAEALSKLVTARQIEGQHLSTVLNGHLDEIERLTRQAEALAKNAPAELRDKLVAQMKELLSSGLSEERLVQEAALLASKADVTEEISRLYGHIANVRGLLKGGGAIGRKLDFMCQELNREANTLCSKSTNLELTNTGVELKVIIEQFREQVQNVE